MEVPTDLGITFGVHVKGGKREYPLFHFLLEGSTQSSARDAKVPFQGPPLPPFPAPATDKWEDEEEEEEEEEDGGCFVPIRPWCKVAGRKKGG